jgi:hypothetical protein
MFSSKSGFALILIVVLIGTMAGAQQASDASAALNSLEQAARNSVGDLSHLRPEKWKADGNTKKQSQADSESLQRNMGSALPELIAAVRSNPQNLNANFKLYRNLNVLFDVFSRFAETVGAFDSKEDFEMISKDLDGIDSARRALADRLDVLTSSAESELAQMRQQKQAAQAAATTAPPKKIVIDDSEPAKPAKKKAAPKKPTSGTSESGNASGQAAPK